MLNYEYILRERTHITEAKALSVAQYLTKNFDKFLMSSRQKPQRDEFLKLCNYYLGQASTIGKEMTNDMPNKYKVAGATIPAQIFAYIIDSCRNREFASTFLRSYAQDIDYAGDLLADIEKLRNEVTRNGRNVGKSTSSLQQKVISQSQDLNREPKP